MSTSVQQVTATAEHEIGYHEGRDANGNWNNNQKYSRQVPGLLWSNYQAWCQTFICWIFWKTFGAKVFGTILPYQPTASCDVALAAYKAAGRFSEYPAIGAQGFLGVPGDAQHTFFVRDFDADFVYTDEGNTNDNGSYQGDGTYRHKRARRDPKLLGYGYPRYPEGIKSADPKFAKEAHVKPTPNPKPKPKSRVEAARALLEDALKATKNPLRKRKIQAALDAAPKK